MQLKQKVAEAVNRLRPRQKPEFAILLGTGLDGLASRIKVDRAVPYSEIPHFAVPTVSVHRGEMIFGTLERRRVVAMSGRLHAYEGYTAEQITLPIRVARALGAKALVVSNAAGGLNPLFQKGDLMLIDDHLNLMGMNPLTGLTETPRFPDMSEPYDFAFQELAEKVAVGLGIRLRRGVYAGLPGPSLETRAEYRMLRALGADAVGMSTVPEVIVAVQAGFRTLGVSVITDLCLPDHLEKANIDEIIATARGAEPMLTELVKRFVHAARV